MDDFDPIVPRGILHGVRPRAVLRGFLWDTGLSILFSLLLTHHLLREGLFASSEAEIDAVFASLELNLLYLPVGLCCTAYGSYLAAVRCPGAETANALGVGVASLLLGLFGSLLPSPAGYPPVWITAIGIALLLPAAAMGGALASRRRSAAATPDPLGGMRR